MIRALSMIAPHEFERGSGVDAPVIKRPADNHAFDAAVAHGKQIFDIPDRGNAARGYDRNADCRGKSACRLDIHALQRAVAVDIGVDDRLDAHILELASKVE